jgi:DNA polymerase I-like protein with 3'-5' exonuclease and polymerase domains
VPIGKLAHARALIDEKMTQAVELQCGLAVEVHTGTNWAEAHA